MPDGRCAPQEKHGQRQTSVSSQTANFTAGKNRLCSTVSAVRDGGVWWNTTIPHAATPRTVKFRLEAELRVFLRTNDSGEILESPRAGGRPRKRCHWFRAARGR